MILQLDFHSETPIYVQIRNEIVKAIGSGELAYGTSLPSVRSLANDLQINSMTVQKAYSILKKEGFITIDRRHGASVNPIYDGSTVFTEKLEEELKLLAIEAAVKGVRKEEFLNLCEHLYQTMDIKDIKGKI